jgi:hypothetical protein
MTGMSMQTTSISFSESSTREEDNNFYIKEKL